MTNLPEQTSDQTEIECRFPAIDPLRVGANQSVTAPQDVMTPTQVELSRQALAIKEVQEFNAMTAPPIIAGRYYRPQAGEMRVFGAVQTLAAWRHKGRGPPYSLCGSNVIYEGSDLLAWLKAQRIDPTKGAA